MFMSYLTHAWCTEQVIIETLWAVSNYIYHRDRSVSHPKNEPTERWNRKVSKSIVKSSSCQTHHREFGKVSVLSNNNVFFIISFNFTLRCKLMWFYFLLFSKLSPPRQKIQIYSCRNLTIEMFRLWKRDGMHKFSTRTSAFEKKRVFPSF